MGILGKIAKGISSIGKKKKESIYKKRDRILSKAIRKGKVKPKDLKALKTVRSQKDTKPKAPGKNGAWGTVVPRASGNLTPTPNKPNPKPKPKKKEEDKDKGIGLSGVGSNIIKGASWLANRKK